MNHLLRLSRRCSTIRTTIKNQFRYRLYVLYFQQGCQGWPNPLSRFNRNVSLTNGIKHPLSPNDLVVHHMAERSCFCRVHGFHLRIDIHYDFNLSRPGSPWEPWLHWKSYRGLWQHPFKKGLTGQATPTGLMFQRVPANKLKFICRDLRKIYFVGKKLNLLRQISKKFDEERCRSGWTSTLGKRVVAVRWLPGSNPGLSVLLRSNIFIFELRSNGVLLWFERRRTPLRSATAIFQSLRAKQGDRFICTQFISSEASNIQSVFISLYRPDSWS